MKTLFVFDHFLNVEKIPPSSFRPDGEIYLFPLTSIVSVTKALNEKIEGSARIVEIVQTAHAVNSAADRLRDKYIRFIAEIPERAKVGVRDLKEFFAVGRYTTLWWLSIISEKNTYKSEAFNKLAQMDSIVETIKNKNIEKVIFSCESEKLKETLKEYAFKNSIAFEISPIGRPSGMRRPALAGQATLYIRNILILLRFAARFFLRSIRINREMSGLNRNRCKDNPLSVVTYYPNIDTGAAKKGVFKNIYYTNLQESLEARGECVTWIFMDAANSSMSLDEALSYAGNFIKNGYTIFFIEEFNSIGIQLKTLLAILIGGLKFLRIEKTISSMHTFGEYNFYSIFKDDWYSSFAGITGYDGLMHYYMFRTLFQKLKSEKYLYYCEMQAWEKAMAAARDSVGSRARLFGYQHGALSNMLLSYFNDPDDTAREGRYAARHPDKIICNGRVAHECFKRSGHPDERLLVAEAIRYNHLTEHLRSNWAKDRKIMLIVFSISPEESSAILNLAYEAFRDIKDMEIWVKPHPFLKIEEVFRLSNMPREAFPFQIKNERITDLFAEARLAIIGESTASIEALAFGCSVVLVDIPEWINMSPLKGIKSVMIKTVSSAHELRQAVDGIFQEGYDRGIYAREASRLINDYFYLNQDSGDPETFVGFLTGSKRVTEDII